MKLTIDQTRGLGSLQKHDIIDFESAQISKDTYMVVSSEKDEEIPAILLQLWRFEGGYNHAFRNVMENDLGLNRQVAYFEPKIEQVIITAIQEYRPLNSGLSKREELFFDIWPQTTSPIQNEKCPIPFKIITDQKKELILPSWTPLQRLPLGRIRVGTKVETWTVKNKSNIMKVIKL